jgi:hypothetical protein
MLLTTGGGFANLMFPTGLPSFGGSFVFLDGVVPFYSLYSSPFFLGALIYL